MFKDPEVERAYGEFLRKARARRLVVVGVLTIFLNTMYDMPEWIITLTSPMSATGPESPELSYVEGPNDFSAFARVRGPHAGLNSLALFLMPLDVIEVLLQLVLAASGYLPFLKCHTERTAVTIMLATALLSSVRPAVLLLRRSEVGDEQAEREVRRGSVYLMCNCRKIDVVLTEFTF